MSRTRIGRSLALASIATAIFAFAGSAPASASVEVGDTCAATTLLGSPSLISLGHGTTNPTLPALVPMSGVITRWSLRTVVGISPPHPQVLKVYRPTAL